MNDIQEEDTKLLWAMDRLHSAWRSIMPKQDLTFAQFGTLFRIYLKGVKNGIYLPKDAEPVTLTELSLATWQSLPTLSQRVYQLETLGYLKRLENPNDRRLICLKLTDKGLVATEKVKCRVDKILRETFLKLGKSAANLVNVLTRLAEAFEYVGEKEKEESMPR